MAKLLLIILIAIWLYSYLHFRGQYKYYLSMLDCLENCPKAKSLPNYELTLAAAHMQAQHYKTAYRIYDSWRNLHLGNVDMSQKVDMNMNFCKNPIPWIHELRDLNGSWWHNFLLVRFAKSHYVMIGEEAALLTNSWIRLKSNYK